MLLKLAKKTFESENLRFALGIPGKDALRKLGIKDPDEAQLLWDEIYREFYPRYAYLRE